VLNKITCIFVSPVGIDIGPKVEKENEYN